MENRRSCPDARVVTILTNIHSIVNYEIMADTQTSHGKAGRLASLFTCLKSDSLLITPAWECPNLKSSASIDSAREDNHERRIWRGNCPAGEPIQNTCWNKDWPADDLNLAKNILARVRKIPGAIARLMAGPPRSERERFNYEVTAARARAIEGISSGWIRFR